jgi:hypothetical protein
MNRLLLSILTLQKNDPSLRPRGTKREAICYITWIKNCADHSQIHLINIPPEPQHAPIPFNFHISTFPNYHIINRLLRRSFSPSSPPQKKWSVIATARHEAGSNLLHYLNQKLCRSFTNSFNIRLSRNTHHSL